MSFATELVEFITSRGIDLNGLNVLDIGSGLGNVVKALKEKGANVYAVDKNPLAIQVGIESGIYTEETAKACSGGDLANQNPFDKKFDLVICSETAQFMAFEEKRDMIHGIRHNCLADNGTFFFHIPSNTFSQAYESLEEAVQHQVELTNNFENRSTRKDEKEAKNTLKSMLGERKEQLCIIDTLLEKYFGKVDAYNVGEAVFVASAPKAIAQCPASTDSNSLSMRMIIQTARRNPMALIDCDYDLMNNKGTSKRVLNETMSMRRDQQRSSR